MAPRSKPPFFSPLNIRSRALVVALTLLGGCTANLVATHRVLPAPPTALVQSVPVGRAPSAVAVDSRTGRVFVANSDDASLSVLDARTGALLRTVALGQYPTTLAVDEAAGRVFTLNSAVAGAVMPPRAAASLSVLDARSGALLHTVTPGASPNALAVDARSGHVFVTSSMDATLSVLDARSGRVLRTIALGGWPQALAVDAAASRVFVGTNGRLAHLVVLDSRSGRQLRTLTVGHSVGAVLAVPHTGRVVVAGDGVLRLLDARRGTLVCQVRVLAVPLPADEVSGRVLVGGAAGLRLLDARTGRWAGPWVLARRALQLVWPQGTAVDAATGRLVVVTRALDGQQRGRLYLLDGRSGRVRRSVPAGDDPVALVVDGRTQHAFVVNQASADVPGAAEQGHRLLTWARRWLPWLPLPRPQRPDAHGRVRIIDLS